MITAVTGKNQITVPAKLARELDIAPDTRLDWTKGDDGILIIKVIPNRAELAKRLPNRRGRLPDVQDDRGSWEIRRSIDRRRRRGHEPGANRGA